MSTIKKNRALLLGFLILSASIFPQALFAHCDTLNGPVVTAARKALETGDVKLVLIWIRAADETEIKHAFEQALSVRKLGGSAKDLADQYFFETLVRLHRAGEGEPYTGLKPAGSELGPAISASDQALEHGSSEAVKNLLNDTMARGLAERFQRVMSLKNYDKNDVNAGRQYVAAYVAFIHYADGLYEAASGASAEHGGE